MAMRRAPSALMGEEVPYEGPKHAWTSYSELLRLTDVPNHLSNNGDVREGRVEEFLAAGGAGDPHTKPFFFPVVSAATCTDSHLEVDQRTADKKTRSAWQLYLNTLPVEHFTLDISALRGVDIRLPLGCGLDLQLVGNMAMVLYNPQRCYLQIGKLRTKLLAPSHLPPMKKRRLGDPEDEQAVRSALAIWRACATQALPPTLHEERETYQAYLREYKEIQPRGD
ncbi:hypothetical protein Taro_002962, partial [Colocasia esculenta]|nr:hypothetical protein [Colocasia esculenta]